MSKARTWFSVGYRNPGHWDVADEGGRHFRIRGESGNVVVHDERPEGHPFPREPTNFKSVTAAMAWIADEYMADR